MLKIKGIKSGAVLQRDENNFCKITLVADFSGEPKSSLGKLTHINNNKWELSDIYLGGPYSITIKDDADSVTFNDIYVGDLWLLAGQSNMEGAGKMRQSQYDFEQKPIPNIRAYYMNEKWDVARPQLHQLWESKDFCIRDPFRSERRQSQWETEYPQEQDDGVGPGLYFAIEMQRYNDGVPQGVIPCGVGGSSLAHWKPNEEDNLYTAMKRRFAECGSSIKGVFWHQGESQTNPHGVENFISDMQNLVASMREDFANQKLPFVQVQINCYRASGRESDIWWSGIRELQRTLEERIDFMATVYSVDCGLDDLIHLSSESQEKIGARAAEAMHNLLTGEGTPSPKFKGFEIVQDLFVPFRANIKIHYSNIVGKLMSRGVPFGFSILDKEDGEPIREIARIDLEGNSLRLVVEIDPKKLEDYYVCYGYGNTYYCNITDEADRSIPAMGPLQIKDYLIK